MADAHGIGVSFWSGTFAASCGVVLLLAIFFSHPNLPYLSHIGINPAELSGASITFMPHSLTLKVLEEDTAYRSRNQVADQLADSERDKPR